AEAIVASDDAPATNTIVATSFVKRLAILHSPGGCRLATTIPLPDGGPMGGPLRTGSIQAANFVRTVEPDRRPAGASGLVVWAIWQASQRSPRRLAARLKGRTDGRRH